MDRFVFAGALAVALSLTTAGVARAHGRLPATGQIVFSPTDPNVIAVRATFGMLISRDGGATWRWICLDVYRADLEEDPSVVLFDDGSIGASMLVGLAHGTDGGCTWGFPSSDLDGVVVADLKANPSDAASAFAVTSSGTTSNRVYRTDDDGQTWTPTSDPIDPILFETMAVAPSDASRIYLTGAYPSDATHPRRPFVYRSEDGGATWQPFAFMLANATANVYLLGVDPQDPDRLFVKEWSDSAPGRVLRSGDGGQTFTEVLSMLPDTQGFAWSPDGETVWVSSVQNGGLWRSTDGGMTFEEERDDVNLACLTLHAGALWACGNNFSDGFAVGRSMDGGSTFEPMLVLDQVAGLIDCPASSDTATTCEPALADLVSDLHLDAGILETPPASTGGGTGGGGCGCSAAGTGAHHSAPGLLACLVLAGVLRLRRRARATRGGANSKANA